MSILFKKDSFHDSGKAFTLKVEGLDLSYRYFMSHNQKKISFIYCHGMQSHQKWFTDSAEEFKARGFLVYTWDRMGSGDSAHIDGLKGHMNSFAIHLKSLENLIARAREDHPENKIVLWGDSYGGKLLAAFAAIEGVVDGFIFSTPGIYHNKEKLKLPYTISQFLFSRNKTYYPSVIPEYGGDNGASMFTAHESYFLKIKNDHQSQRSFTRKFYLETSKLDKFIQKKTKNVAIPSLLLLIGDDSMVDNKKNQKFFRERFLKVDVKIYQTDKKNQHYLMFTSARERAFNDVEIFMQGLP